MIHYRFAYDAHDQLISIEALDHDRDRHDAAFRCIACGNELIAKTRGEQRQKHFAHKGTVECNEETYLHRLAKRVFIDEYNHCLKAQDPFTIELHYARVCTRFQDVFGWSCPCGMMSKSYDLTKYFTLVSEEIRDGEFVPDILLRSASKPDEVIYIEFVVTHFMSERKRLSGRRMIELAIESEEDLTTIRSHAITPENAALFNFNTTSQAVTDSECTCKDKDVLCFRVYTNGKSHLSRMVLHELIAGQKHLEESTRYIALFDDTRGIGHFDMGGRFIRCVEEAHERGFTIRNCFVCKYHGTPWNSITGQGAYCHILKKSCNSNDAVSCKYFRYRVKRVEDE